MILIGNAAVSLPALEALRFDLCLKQAQQHESDGTGTSMNFHRYVDDLPINRPILSSGCGRLQLLRDQLVPSVKGHIVQFARRNDLHRARNASNIADAPSPVARGPSAGARGFNLGQQPGMNFGDVYDGYQ